MSSGRINKKVVAGSNLFHFFYLNDINLIGRTFKEKYNFKDINYLINPSESEFYDALEYYRTIDNENYNVRGRETSQRIFRDEHTLSNITFSLGYENEFSENFSFKSNLGSAWRTPNMAELYSFGSHGFKNSFGLLRYYYNDDNKIRTNRVTLMSESLTSSEKSLKFINEFDFTSDKNKIKLTLFSNYILKQLLDR